MKINLKRIIPECHHFDPEVKRKTHLNIFLLHFKTEKKTDNFIKIMGGPLIGLFRRRSYRNHAISD